MGNIDIGSSPGHTPAPDRAKDRSGRAVVLLLVIGLAIMAVLVACGSSSSQPTKAPSQATVGSASTPALDGATLLETHCSGCHSADRAKQAKKTQAQWDQTVTRMIANGAQLTPDEKKVLVDYLAKTYGP
jgi:hypothetical protein